MRIPPALAPHLPKINLVTLCLAAVVFVMPWTQIECSGRLIATQSGVQAVYSGATLSEDMQRLADDPSKGSASDEKPEFAYLVGVALLLTLSAIALSALALLARKRLIDSGLLAALALVVLLTQAAIGFPVDRWAKQSSDPQTPKNQSADPMAAMMGAALSITTVRTNWFYLELFLLAAPTALFVWRLAPEGSRRGFEMLPEASRAPGSE